MSGSRRPSGLPGGTLAVGQEDVVDQNDNITTHQNPLFGPAPVRDARPPRDDGALRGRASDLGARRRGEGPLFSGGNAYLAREFPRLDFIRRARVVEEP